MIVANWTEQDDKNFDQIVKATLKISDAQYSRKLKIGEVDEWDSLGHLSLIFEIETKMNRKFPVDVIPELDSLQSILDFLKK